MFCVPHTPLVDEKHNISFQYIHASNFPSHIIFKDTSSKFVNLTYWIKCPDRRRAKSSICGGLKIGDIVHLKIELLVEACPTIPSQRSEVFRIYPEGLNQMFLVNLDIFCTCGCEGSGFTYEDRSPKCNEHGIVSCGVCRCYEGFYGETCELQILDPAYMIPIEMFNTTEVTLT